MALLSYFIYFGSSVNTKFLPKHEKSAQLGKGRKTLRHKGSRGVARIS